MNNKCPCCGAEMTPGVIQSRSSVYWSREADSVAAFSFLDDGALPLADQGGATLGGASAPAYNCTRCKKSSWTIPFAICPPDFSLFLHTPLQNPNARVIIPYVNRGARRSGLRVGCHRPDPST